MKSLADKLQAEFQVKPIHRKGKTIRVIVAEDNAVVRRSLCLLLNAQADIRVIGQAPDGEKAVQLSKQLRPDVILMDFNMPKMDGVKATKLIRFLLPSIRIIGHSGIDDRILADKFLCAGADAFLAKGSKPDTLLETIRNKYSMHDAKEFNLEREGISH